MGKLETLREKYEGMNEELDSLKRHDTISVTTLCEIMEPYIGEDSVFNDFHFAVMQGDIDTMTNLMKEVYDVCNLLKLMRIKVVEGGAI